MIDDFCFFVFLFVCPIVSILGFISFTCHSYLYILHDTACLARVLPTMALALVLSFPFFLPFHQFLLVHLLYAWTLSQKTLSPDVSISGIFACTYTISMPVQPSRVKSSTYYTPPLLSSYSINTAHKSTIPLPTNSEPRLLITHET